MLSPKWYLNWWLPVLQEQSGYSWSIQEPTAAPGVFQEPIVCSWMARCCPGTPRAPGPLEHPGE